MKFYQVIHKINHSPVARSLINPFIGVEWFHSFECNFSLLEINYLIKDLYDVSDKYRIPRKTLNNSDYNYINNRGWCPLYWYIDLDVCKTNYGHTLYCENLIKTKDVDAYVGLQAFKRNNYIDTLLDGLVIEGQE